LFTGLPPAIFLIFFWVGKLICRLLKLQVLFSKLQVLPALLDEPVTAPRWQGETSTYGAAVRLGMYLGMNDRFMPPQEKYSIGGSLSQDFFVDTVRNAQKWWTENKERIKAKATRKA
jgi:hypothetical protein